MRRALAIPVLVAACAPRAQPYRFGPLIGSAMLDHRAPRANVPVPLPVPDRVSHAPLADADPRALVGARDDRDPLAFAHDLRARLVGDRPDAAAASLSDVARGDLLVFDRGVVAVALAVDDRGVVEMLYLARGVVRRGFVDPAHPASKRDEHGRIRNTFLRHREESPPDGTRFLAGELLARVIH